MALIGNYSVYNKNAVRLFAGPTLPQTRAQFNTFSSSRNANTSFGYIYAIPSGYYGGYAWAMPQTVGAMSSFTAASGVIVPTVNLAGGYNLLASQNISITVTNAQLDQIVTFIASSLMSLISSGEMTAAVQLQLSGVMSIATNVNIQAIINTTASGSMSIGTTAILTALAHMEAETGGPTPLSPEGLAVAVWDYLQSEPTQSASMKEAVEVILSNARLIPATL